MKIKQLDLRGMEGGLARMVDRLVKEGTFTGEPEADDFLRGCPEAVLLGLLYDQRVRAEYAFTGPGRLHERLGHLDMQKIARMRMDQLVKVFEEKPAVHRFTNKMALYTRDLAKAIVTDYDGKAENLWNDGADFTTIEQRALQLPGFGKAKAMKLQVVLHYLGYRDFSR